MTVSRRSFIGGLAALFAAPAIVKAASLMPVRSMVPEPEGMFILPPYICLPNGDTEVLYGMLLVRPEWGLSANLDGNTSLLEQRTGERREGIVVIRRRVLLPNPQADNRRQVA